MYATSVIFTRRRLVASVALAAVVVLSGCAAAGNGAVGDPQATGDITDVGAASGPSADSAHFDQLPADGQFQRFIVKYRADSAPGRTPEAARERLTSMQASSGIQLEWLRRLGVDADVIKADRPLDRKAAAALMDRFSADPDVEYIEIDGVLTIRSNVDVPPVKPLG